MQDFNYLFAGTMEVTVEVSCCKFPSRKRLVAEWVKNKESLFNFVAQAQRGIKGYVRDAQGKPVPDAKIRVRRHPGDSQDGLATWRNSTVTSDKNGVYWRVLVPGVYDVQAILDAEDPRTGATSTAASSVIVSDVSVPDRDAPTPLDLVLENFVIEDGATSSAKEEDGLTPPTRGRGRVVTSGRRVVKRVRPNSSNTRQVFFL